ncbi:MAG: phenylalanine--tRNA ligase subunit alpha [Thermoplasmata archaeon]|nr:phenylalanine--tRNA ligase subunit alpha [Thermoplasmata archaeon]
MAEPTEATPPGGTPISLSEPERLLLARLQASPSVPLGEPELVAQSGLPIETVRGSLQRLRSKQLAVADERRRETRSLTPRGKAALGAGLPERRLLDALRAADRPVAPNELSIGELTEQERSVAIGILRRKGLLAQGAALALTEAAGGREPWPEEEALRALGGGDATAAPESFAALQRRGLASSVFETERFWSPSSEGRTVEVREDANAVGALTPGLLASGTWKAHVFRPYDVRAVVPHRTGGRPHPYREWIREFEEILIGLGFSEATGPLLETEFWNSDVLFMPQEHPVRSIHDVLAPLDLVAGPPPGPLLERVAAAHEGRALPGENDPISPGWRARYDPAIARRPTLRSQTTAVSARFLASHPAPPFRLYCIGRNFRRDAVDATHHVEFDQCEGVLGEASTSLRDLVGIFQALAEAIGIRELKFRPSYFPFTEPSLEGYVRHPRLGWIEVFPGGMFRPEVLRPLGVEVPVAAWGIGIARLAMVALGISDVRELYLDELPRLTAGRV